MCIHQPQNEPYLCLLLSTFNKATKNNNKKTATKVHKILPVAQNAVSLHSFDHSAASQSSCVPFFSVERKSQTHETAKTHSTAAGTTSITNMVLRSTATKKKQDTKNKMPAKRRSEKHSATTRLLSDSNDNADDARTHCDDVSKRVHQPNNSTTGHIVVPLRLLLKKAERKSSRNSQTLQSLAQNPGSVVSRLFGKIFS